MEEKKPNVTVQNYVYDVLMRDIDIFRTNKNELCNNIFRVLKENFDQIINNQKNQTVRFNLHKKNIFDFEEFRKGRIEESESEMLSKLFTIYVNMPQYKRERVLNKEKFDILEKAVRLKHKVVIQTTRGNRTVDPYFITNNIEEEYNYLVCRKDGEDRIINYRVLNIENVKLKSEHYKLSREEEMNIESLKKNFDPFLSLNKNITIRFDEEGIELFQTVVHNRPTLIEPKKAKEIKVGEYCIVACSERKAIAYFMQFGAKVEIIEPQEVRARIGEIYKSGNKLYNE